MRFNKKSRKLRAKKRRGRNGSSFWFLMAGGIVIFALFLYLTYGGHRKRLYQMHLAKIGEDMDRICVAAILFYQDHGRYPSTREGIEALLADRVYSSQPVSSRVGYLERVLHDPWGNQYVYEEPQETRPPTWISLGADGKTGGGGEDVDITREGCKSTGFTGE